MIFDSVSKKLMAIDFERSDVHTKRALSAVNANGAMQQTESDKPDGCVSAFDNEMRATRIDAPLGEEFVDLCPRQVFSLF